jgi:chemotaxis protein CheX
MNQKQIEASIHAATAEVFSTMLGMEVVPLPARVDSTAPSVADGVLAFVGLAGSWIGTGAVAVNATFAREICEQLLMTEAPSVNEDVLDAVGEVANMIIGNFKTAAEELLGPMGLSIPTVIYGRNFTSRSLGKSSWIILPFSCKEHVLEVRICLTPCGEPATPRHGYSQTVVLS